jgi:putative sporulation protein YyaC
MRVVRSNDALLKVSYNDPNVAQLLNDRLRLLMTTMPAESQPVIVCVGTDRSTGDALGPLVGSELARYTGLPFHLFGTLEKPVHAMNLSETLLEITNSIFNPFIIGIDACLGQASSVGFIQVGTGPVRPGAGVNKDLPPVGDIHITGIVNVGGFMEYFVLQNTRLHLVVHMSRVIAQNLLSAFSSHSLETDKPAATLE